MPEIPEAVVDDAAEGLDEAAAIMEVLARQYTRDKDRLQDAKVFADRAMYYRAKSARLRNGHHE